MDNPGLSGECLVLGYTTRRRGKLKKLVVKPCDFTYQFGQMHRVGAGGKLFLPQFVVYKKRVPK
jgi:hypothetical protein